MCLEMDTAPLFRIPDTTHIRLRPVDSRITGIVELSTTFPYRMLTFCYPIYRSSSISTEDVWPLWWLHRVDFISGAHLWKAVVETLSALGLTPHLCDCSARAERGEMISQCHLHFYCVNHWDENKFHIVSFVVTWVVAKKMAWRRRVEHLSCGLEPQARPIYQRHI